MALFSKTKKTEKGEKVEKAPKPSKAAAKSSANVPAVVENKNAPKISNVTHVVLRPHITEKSGVLSQTGKYTFQISKDANKRMVSLAIEALYKVKPVRVSIVNLPSRNVFVRGKRGVVSGVRKAVVTLKKGEVINFV